MARSKWIVCGAWCVVLTLILYGSAFALLIDAGKTLQVSGKAQSRFSFRTQTADTPDLGTGFSYPNVYAGNLVQQRNLILLEVTHDLKNLMDTVDLLYPFRALDLRVKYHIVGRFMYEGVYDYGPEAFQDVQDADKENIDSFKQAYDLWECYADISRGPLFFRIGRQNLSWGETDMFRLLDNINPLDNTFGGPFEDLDDRRIPLTMLRGSYNLGNVGPVSSVTLEGFWVPGFWDAHVAPWAPKGTPYSAPLAPDLLRFLSFDYPGKKMDNSRWGVRLMGMIGPNLSLAVGHYKTFLDMPALSAVIDQDKLLSINIPSLGAPFKTLASLDAMTLQASYPMVSITGASMSYFESHLNAVLRGELAWFWDEPVLIPKDNLSALYGPVVPLPDWALDLAESAFGVDIRDLGLTGLPLNPESGTIPEKEILKYMIGFDRQTWIRPLNKTCTFFFSFQYFGQWVPDYDAMMRQGIELYPDPVDFAAVREVESVFTGMVNTMYINGRLSPQLAAAYDVRGAWLVSPSLNYIWEPFRFNLTYAAILGNMTNFGAFRDRDQITFSVSYLLN